ncbi:hypothetical protein PoB_007097300 [Plakobranchus ocellatus]|uniref:Uncharacterized protein n=1 Tax=Plakobranchus ocellatus TaxID=259542 RepID=A0AAV4DK68_9GAST|nr:hypothetical protein PoB_007097300 [Plakobranchus ocellatus]
MPESRSVKRKADFELAPPYLKRAKMTLNHAPKLKFCLKKARRRGASKKLAQKKVRFEMPVQAPEAYSLNRKMVVFIPVISNLGKSDGTTGAALGNLVKADGLNIQPRPTKFISSVSCESTWQCLVSIILTLSRRRESNRRHVKQCPMPRKVRILLLLVVFFPI